MSARSRHLRLRRRAKDVVRDVVDARNTEECERPTDVGLQHFEHPVDATFALSAESEHPRPAGEAGARTEGARLDGVFPSTDAAVDQYLNLVAHSLHDRRKDVDRGRETVELAPAVV